MEQASGTKRTCTTCDHAEPDVAFYAVGSECKGCKRLRSKRNRQEAARKLAIAERLFVDALTCLAGEPALLATGRRRVLTKKGPAAVQALADPTSTAAPSEWETAS